jgi:hypothetical protein
MNLPETSLAHGVGKGIFFGILVVVVFTIICGTALALPTPSGGAGNSNQGIPEYWPYHALLMSAGLILFIAGLITARYHKTRDWYKTHMILQVTGGTCIIAGLVVGVYMVALSGFPQLFNIHEKLGVAIAALVIMTIIIGYSIRRVKRSKTAIRFSHRWLGRIIIALMVINIILGIYYLSRILGR